MSFPVINSTSSTTGQTGTTFGVTAPAGITDGDTLIAIQAINLEGGSGPTTPTNWFPLGFVGFGGGCNVVLYTKIAASEPGSYTFNNVTGGPPSTSDVYIFDITGYTGGGPYIGLRNDNGIGNTSAVLLATSTAYTNALVLAVVSVNGSPGITAPGGNTDIGTLSNLSISLDVSSFNHTSGTVASQTATLGGASFWGTIFVVIGTPPPSINNHCTLFIHGEESSTGDIPLYVDGGQTASGGIPLYINNGATKNCPLFIHGFTPLWHDCPLFIHGIQGALGAVPLFIHGGEFLTTSMPLVLWASPSGIPWEMVPLLVYGGSGGGFINEGIIPLAMQGSIPIEAGGMNLFLKAASSAFLPNNMNLVLPYVEYRSTCRSLGLVAWNVAVGENIPLFLQVDGTLVGGQAAHTGMNLFLKRPFENGTTLFLQGPGPSLDEFIALFLDASVGESRGIPLVVPSTRAPISGSPILYAHGW